MESHQAALIKRSSHTGVHMKDVFTNAYHTIIIFQCRKTTTRAIHGIQKDGHW